ncbi:hypothetical protein [Devosia sp. 1635]|uniref:hypothetical protein n=1 Tax=Devosia sp. 1635 TaxID=2726066 RepID=UPI001566A237|nr:hypothetical protein [Devosia sp. 1635]
MSRVHMFLRVAASAALLTTVALAQESPFVRPNSVSTDELIFTSVGFWINAQRICGIDYDPEGLNAQIQLSAQLVDMSVPSLMQRAQEFADYAAPHVTNATCREATKQAKRMGILAGYKPPKLQTPAPGSLSE